MFIFQGQGKVSDFKILNSTFLSQSGKVRELSLRLSPCLQRLNVISKNIYEGIDFCSYIGGFIAKGFVLDGQ